MLSAGPLIPRLGDWGDCLFLQCWRGYLTSSEGRGDNTRAGTLCSQQFDVMWVRFVACHCVLCQLPTIANIYVVIIMASRKTIASNAIGLAVPPLYCWLPQAPLCHLHSARSPGIHVRTPNSRHWRPGRCAVMWFISLPVVLRLEATVLQIPSVPPTLPCLLPLSPVGG